MAEALAATSSNSTSNDVDMQTSTAEFSNEPHAMRVTNHGKINGWVTFALDFLDKNENRPLVFHTLPLAKSKESPEKITEPSSSTAENPKPPDAPSTSSKSPATAVVPRLISVVEIIKREYIKSLELKNSTRLTGLHQYNEISYLEKEFPPVISDDADVNEEHRLESVRMALQGKNFPKQKQTPFMRITLSLSELPELAQKGASYQAPTIRKLSKSAKTRMKKRKRKEDNPDEQENENEPTEQQ